IMSLKTAVITLDDTHTTQSLRTYSNPYTIIFLIDELVQPFEKKSFLKHHKHPKPIQQGRYCYGTPPKQNP
ncbi:hypothetical protein, partial [Planktothrix sp.]|uniref:hypothetical protein n=1 Tax=Planktothrix sp. TaxID=3088171 RepID=UPI0038D45914